MDITEFPPGVVEHLGWYVYRRIDPRDPTGDLKQVSEWPKVWQTTLSGLDVVEMSAERNTVALLKKVKCPDKMKNLELLGKHITIQVFKDQVDQKVVATHYIIPSPSSTSVDD